MRAWPRPSLLPPLQHRVCNDPVTSSPEEAAAQLDAGADIDFRHPTTGQTPLMTSVLSGKPALVKLLLERGADVTVPEKDGYTPAHGAGFQGRAEIMEMLHVHGIDVVNDVHSDGFTPLHRACWGSEPRHTDTVRFLIDGAGADPARKGAKDGRSPLQVMRDEPRRIGPPTL